MKQKKKTKQQKHKRILKKPNVTVVIEEPVFLPDEKGVSIFFKY